MTAPAAPLNLDSAELAFRRASLLTVLGSVTVVVLITLSVQAYWQFTLADQLQLAVLGVKNVVLFTWLWRRPQAFRMVGIIEVVIQAVTLVLRLYFTLHSAPGYQGLGGYAPWMIFAYLVTFVALPARAATVVTVGLFTAMLGVIMQYALDPTVTRVMKVGLGNALLQTTLMHGTFIAYLVLQQRLLGRFVLALLSAREEASLAHVDPLTGLPNRRQLTQWLRDALSRQDAGESGRATPVSVVLFDLDHFKRVNDTYGHDVGDEVLQHVARGMRRSVRQGDHVGRWGGEEFLILVQGDATTAQLIADRLRVGLRQAPHLQAGVITVSCGVAQGHPGETLEDVLRRADEAMYHAKSAGRDTVTIAA